MLFAGGMKELSHKKQFFSRDEAKGREEVFYAAAEKMQPPARRHEGPLKGEGGGRRWAGFSSGLGASMKGRGRCGTK